MSAIGKRTVDLFIGADITFYDPALKTTRTVYWSNQSWMTNPYDSIARNRQYVGLLMQAFDMRFSWFEGDKIGGRSRRNFGTLRAANPGGVHSLDYIFEDDLSVQGRTITFRIGEIGDDLADMITFSVRGREVRQSEDGTEVVIELADEGQITDTSIFIDRFQGLGFALEHAQGEFSTIPSAAALNPSTSFVVDVSYALTSGLALSGDVSLLNRAATAGGRLYRLYAKPAGTLAFAMRSSTADVFLDATDIPWVADGRFHRVVGRWNGTAMHLFHSSRTGGVRSSVSSGVSTIDTSATALSVGDENSGLAATNGWVRIADVRVAIDTPLTDAQIIDRMKRPLTAAEIADYEAYIKINENTGTTSADETGNGHTLTKHASATWVPTFEGRDEMAGRAKPLIFGGSYQEAVHLPITWADREEGVGLVHAGLYNGARAVYEGALRLVVGWPKTQFHHVSFGVTAADEISIATIGKAGPGFAGLVAGQQIVIAGTASNDGTKTLLTNSTDRIIKLTTNLTVESDKNPYITANNAAGTAPDAALHFHAGGVKLLSVPSLPVTAHVLGDAEEYSGSASYTVDGATRATRAALIMQRILTGWAGLVFADFGTISGGGFGGGIAGVWLDPGRDRTIRDVLDDGADTAWLRWGPRPTDGKWDLLRIEAPSGAADLALGTLQILKLRRLRSVPPVGGFTLRCARNYRVLEEGEIAGAALAADSEVLRRPHLEGSAVVDSTVAASFPDAETPEAIDTWLLGLVDARGEAQRRYDTMKEKRAVYEAGAILFGLDKNPLSTLLNFTHEDFAALVAGKDLHLVELKAKDEETTLAGWG